MNIAIELDKDDWLEFHKYVSKRQINAFKKATDSFWFNLILVSALTIIFLYLFNTISEFHLPSAVITIFIFILVLTIMHLKSRKFIKAYEPTPGGSFIGVHNFEIDESGIRSYSEKYDAKHSWNIVQEIVRDAGMIMIFIDTAMAFIFPEKKLDNPDEFYRQVNTYYEDHKIQSQLDSR